jgi:hypothetical protein
VDNQVRLQLFVLAYNLGNFLRQAVLPKSVSHWTLTTLRENDSIPRLTAPALQLLVVKRLALFRGGVNV